MLTQPSSWLRLICLSLLAAVTALTSSGCQTQRPVEEIYEEDPDEIIARIEKGEMLHQRFILDVRGYAFIPVDPDFNVGGGIGFKGELEVYKNLYLGISFDWARNEVDETIGDLLKDFNGGNQAADAAARGADPEQWFERFDRYNILFLFDYDVPLIDSDLPPTFRFGLGVGAILVDGETVDDSVFADNVDSRLFSQLLVRPSVGFRFPVHKNIVLFTDATYDFVPEDELSIEGNLVGRRSSLDGDVQFGGFTLGAGISFTW